MGELIKNTGKWYKLNNDTTKDYTDTLVYKAVLNGVTKHAEYNRIYKNTGDIYWTYIFSESPFSIKMYIRSFTDSGSGKIANSWYNGSKTTIDSLTLTEIKTGIYQASWTCAVGPSTGELGDYPYLPQYSSYDEADADFGYVESEPINLTKDAFNKGLAMGLAKYASLCSKEKLKFFNITGLNNANNSFLASFNMQSPKYFYWNSNKVNYDDVYIFIYGTKDSYIGCFVTKSDKLLNMGGGWQAWYASDTKNGNYSYTSWMSTPRSYKGIGSTKHGAPAPAEDMYIFASEQEAWLEFFGE